MAELARDAVVAEEGREGGGGGGAAAAGSGLAYTVSILNGGKTGAYTLDDPSFELGIKDH